MRCCVFIFRDFQRENFRKLHPFIILAMAAILPPIIASAESDNDLFMACMVGDEEGVVSALASGANPNYLNPHGITPVHVICGGVGPAASLQHLLDAGADVDCMDSNLWTPLIYVASSGQLPLFNILVAGGGKLSHESKDGWSPLSRAAYRGHAHIVERLLQLGVTVSPRAIELATQEGHTHVLALLLTQAGGVVPTMSPPLVTATIEPAL